MPQHESDRQLQTEDLLADDRRTDTDAADTGHSPVEPDGTTAHSDGAYTTDASATQAHGTRAADDYGTDATDPSAGAADWHTEPGLHGTTEPPYQDAAPTEAIPEQQEVRESGVPVATEGEEPGAPLFGDDEVGRFREQWQSIQTTFVDDPQDAVRNADHLVAEVMQALAATFTEHKRGLEEAWQSGSDAQTEELRQALRRYRSFFNQLLHT
ncbi:hypothetical protein V5P93_001240 [Actinokineospora auranticolor]|uniref:Uncharacterized protein n=1 Tax=Actinokineospora auranticolor TaxID=155976 RepID=A0A2S6GUF4_9PSEU|nr:hypothetical protein [Actinokineospora auranticolor]PPK68868.1 hypothetical protein CLV40_104112 [Actinokineospora auranticolor]